MKARYVWPDFLLIDFDYEGHHGPGWPGRRVSAGCIGKPPDDWTLAEAIWLICDQRDQGLDNPAGAVAV